jgi:hypothetical protein
VKSYKEAVESISEMEIGNRLAPDNNTNVTRVPGGWVWTDIKGTCFIPYSEYFSDPD